MKTQLNMKKNLDKFIPITKVVDYYPPKFVENWDGSFNKIKIGKTYYFRPVSYTHLTLPTSPKV